MNTASPASPSIARQQQLQQQQFSPLLRLPHELLIIITDEVVVQDKPLLPHSKLRFVKKNKNAAVGSSYSPLLNVLLACRALYFVGIEVYYGRNTLRFQHSEHFRKFGSGLNDDQWQCISGIELNVEWANSRKNPLIWYPLHECNYCSEWKDVIEYLPKLRTIIVRNVTKFGELEMSTRVNTGPFEARMREEIGNDKSGKLRFLWPGSEQIQS